jgi:hypothetical protein
MAVMIYFATPVADTAAYVVCCVDIYAVVVVVLLLLFLFLFNFGFLILLRESIEHYLLTCIVFICK